MLNYLQGHLFSVCVRVRVRAAFLRTGTFHGGLLVLPETSLPTPPVSVDNLRTPSLQLPHPLHLMPLKSLLAGSYFYVPEGTHYLDVYRGPHPK